MKKTFEELKHLCSEMKQEYRVEETGEDLSEAYYQDLDRDRIYMNYVRPDHPLPNPHDEYEEGRLQIGAHFFRFSSKKEFESFLKALNKAWKEAQRKGFSEVPLR